MPKLSSVHRLLAAVGGSSATLMLTTASSSANTIARTPVMTNNAVVGLLIIAGFVGAIYMLIAGALHVERRDARLGRSGSQTQNGWFGIFGGQSPDDDDFPDIHHHGGGGDGGEAGGEGGY